MEYQSPLFYALSLGKGNARQGLPETTYRWKWQTWTWQQVAQEVRQLAAALQALALPPQ